MQRKRLRVVVVGGGIGGLFAANALIAAGLDIVSVSQRLGHGSPAITLSVYAHRFVAKDAAAAKAIAALLAAVTTAAAR